MCCTIMSVYYCRDDANFDLSIFSGTSASRYPFRGAAGNEFLQGLNVHEMTPDLQVPHVGSSLDSRICPFRCLAKHDGEVGQLVVYMA